MKIVEKNIRYNEEVDTYYVQFNFADRVPSKLYSFPTLEDARAYRDAVNKEKLDLKIRESVARIRASDRSKIIFDISHFKVYPFNIFRDANIDNVPNELLDEGTFENEFLKAHLNERKIDCLLGVYKRGETLDFIGKKYKITRERVRQIVCRSVLIIRNALIRYEVDKKHADIIKAIREIGIIADDVEIYFGKKKEEAKRQDRNLDDLDLSVRTYNCLKRRGIKTLDDLLKMSQEEIMHIRNLGKKSYREIINRLYELGYKCCF